MKSIFSFHDTNVCYHLLYVCVCILEAFVFGMPRLIVAISSLTETKGVLQSGIKLDLNLEKGRTKDDFMSLHDKIKDTHSVLADRVKDNRNRIDTEVFVVMLVVDNHRHA